MAPSLAYRHFRSELGAHGFHTLANATLDLEVVLRGSPFPLLRV
jgi:hypothetical protein